MTTISCSTDVHRRFGASVLGVVPKMHLDTEAQHYIGLSWADGDQASKIEAVLKLSNGEFSRNSRRATRPPRIAAIPTWLSFAAR